jgi:hypothetical protein
MLNIIEDNELQYQHRRKLIELKLEREDYEPAITNTEFIGETCEEFYRRSWLDDFRNYD